MDKIWHHAVIRYLQKKGLTTKEIHTDMVSTLGDDAPALSTVKKWAAEFKRGRESKILLILQNLFSTTF